VGALQVKGEIMKKVAEAKAVEAQVAA